MTTLPSMTRRRPCTAQLRDERGSVSVIAAAVAFPAVIALLAAFFQAALWFAARSAALTAAQQGLDAARGTSGSLTHGEATACTFARTVGAGMLHGPTCTGSTGATVTITVCGDAPSLIGLFPVRACEQAQGARERFTTRVSGFSNPDGFLGPEPGQRSPLIGIPGHRGEGTAV
jgi:hypothetical protein